MKKKNLKIALREAREIIEHLDSLVHRAGIELVEALDRAREAERSASSLLGHIKDMEAADELNRRHQ